MKEFIFPKKEVAGTGDEIGECTRLVLPEGVKIIEDFAFFGQEFEEVILPEGLEEIGAGAFEACSALVRVIFPQSLQKLGEYAFDRCTALRSSGTGLFTAVLRLKRSSFPKRPRCSAPSSPCAGRLRTAAP